MQHDTHVDDDASTINKKFNFDYWRPIFPLLQSVFAHFHRSETMHKCATIIGTMNARHDSYSTSKSRSTGSSFELRSKWKILHFSVSRQWHHSEDEIHHLHAGSRRDVVMILQNSAAVIPKWLLIRFNYTEKQQQKRTSKTHFGTHRKRLFLWWKSWLANPSKFRGLSGDFFCGLCWRHHQRASQLVVKVLSCKKIHFIRKKKKTVVGCY